jgi:hypothetical protein
MTQLNWILFPITNRKKSFLSLICILRILKLNFISSRFDFHVDDSKRTKIQFLVIFTTASRKGNKHPNFITAISPQVFGIICICVAE